MPGNRAAILSLFSSASTLICCALPALVVAVAGGATLAGIISNFPQLIWLSEHKTWLFTVGGLLLALASYMEWKNRNAPCPADPAAAKMCQRMRRVGKTALVFSFLMYMTGFFFAFVAPYVF